MSLISAKNSSLQLICEEWSTDLLTGAAIMAICSTNQLDTFLLELFAKSRNRKERFPTKRNQLNFHTITPTSRISRGICHTDLQTSTKFITPIWKVPFQPHTVVSHVTHVQRATAKNLSLRVYGAIPAGPKSVDDQGIRRVRLWVWRLWCSRFLVLCWGLWVFGGGIRRVVVIGGSMLVLRREFIVVHFFNWVGGLKTRDC